MDPLSWSGSVWAVAEACKHVFLARVVLVRSGLVVLELVQVLINVLSRPSMLRLGLIWDLVWVRIRPQIVVPDHELGPLEVVEPTVLEAASLISK